MNSKCRKYKCALIIVLTILNITLSNEKILKPLALENTIATEKVNDNKLLDPIDNDFSLDSIVVVLNPEDSQYTGIANNILKKLKNIDEISTIDNLTELPYNNLSYTNLTLNKNHFKDFDKLKIFKQIIRLNLNTASKEVVIDVIKKIELFNEVLYVGPDYICTSNSVTPDDTYYSDQWALDNENGISIEEAWKFSTGSRNVRVGIIDTGIAEHEDLNTNVAEGYDYANDNSITTDDIGGHGTKVAGIIGAIGNNRKGITGINQNVTLVPLQAAYDTSYAGYYRRSDIVDAILDARDMWDTERRISIINYSLTNFGISLEILAAIEQFPGLFIWAAGNDGKNVDTFRNIDRFNVSNLISVGAHDSNNKRSIWSSSYSSNYGTAVNIYAPGGKGMTQNTSNCLTTTSNPTNEYTYFNGTSCSAPHVTGVAALLLSINPNLTTIQLKNAILNSAENINITIPDGSTQTVRKLNAYNAVKYVLANYSEDTLTLKYNTKSTSKSIDATSTFFNEKNYFLKMDVENAYEYDFTISSSCALEVTLYDSSFNKITTSQTSTNNDATKTFSHYLSVGTYYLKTNYLNSSANGTINVSIIGESHTHSYELKYYNYKWHKLTCGCGDTTGDVSVHTILQSEIVNNRYAKCLGCKQRLDLNKDMALIGGMNSLATKMSKNGSYILPSGIIVLVEEDIEAYLDGTLVFYVKDKVPVIQ